MYNIISSKSKLSVGWLVGWCAALKRLISKVVLPSEGDVIDIFIEFCGRPDGNASGLTCVMTSIDGCEACGGSLEGETHCCQVLSQIALRGYLREDELL